MAKLLGPGLLAILLAAAALCAAPSAEAAGVASRIKILNKAAGTSNKGILALALYYSDAAEDISDWSYICDDGSFTNTEAAYFCTAKGYKFGRTYTVPGGNFPKNLPSTAPPADGSWSSLMVFSGCHMLDMRRHLRGLKQIMFKKIDVSSKMECGFRTRLPSVNPLNVPECLGKQFVGVECSNSKFNPAPPPVPPPPSPSPPPPRPPNYSTQIKVVSPLEPNLCPASTDGLCDEYNAARVEVQSSGKWAPLCWPEKNVANWTISQIGEVICRQAQDWPYSLEDAHYGGSMMRAPFPLPTGTPKAGDFKVSGYSAWARLPDKVPADLDKKLALQQLGLKVSSTKCTKGLFSVQCFVALA